MLADDNVPFREALQRFLRPRFNIVGAVGDGQALIEAAEALSPDVILADISMPTLNGLQALRRLRAGHPKIRFIFLTVHEELAFLSAAKKAGALGYVLKRCASFDLLPAIAEALDGRPFVSAAIEH